jgi:hypothetical protein
MVAQQAVLASNPDPDPGMLGADDARIPAHVRSHYRDYDKTVATVVPVIGMRRQEWWLFDAEGTLVDVLVRHN